MFNLYDEKECPHCEYSIYEDNEPLVMNQLGRNWHRGCWEVFKLEYEEILNETVKEE